MKIEGKGRVNNDEGHFKYADLNMLAMVKEDKLKFKRFL